MEYKKTIILLALVVFLLSIAGVSASEIGDTIASENANTIELSVDNDIGDNLQTSEENEALASTDYDDAIAQTDTEVLGEGSATYSDLAKEIGHSGNITLTHKNYTYDKDATAIDISEDNKVIDGNGAVIDMNGSTIRAFFISASGVTIKNLTIINANYDGGNGGAIYFSSSATSGTVTNCNFANNTANLDGSAVYFSYGGTVSNCNFTDNEARDGGAVCFENTGTVTNCNFTGNTANSGGSVFFYLKGNVTNCNFTNNKATGDDACGGAIFFVNTGTVTNCNFTDNTATEDGGAIYFLDQGTVTNCNFTDNTADYGGAVYFWDPGTVTNCNFVNNTASEEGGAVYFWDPGTVTNCNFTDNKATGDDACGGAVYFQSTGNVTNCNFTDNTATMYGGAIFFVNTGNVTNCNFADNSAFEGGAIFSMECYTTVDTCIFKKNSGDDVNTVIYPPTLNVDNFTTSYGSKDKLTFDLKTNSSIPVTNGNISISVYFKGNGEWVRNYTCLSGEGWIPDLPVGSYIAVFDTEYAKFQKINRTITITAPEHTFWFLNYTINGNDNPVIELSHDFYFDPAYDAAFVNGIVINRPVTIKGNGNAIDANRQARIFYVQSENAVLENLTLKNAHSNSGGGAVYFSGTGEVTNCNFVNYSATGEGSWGGAIRMYSGTVSNCNFTDNSATVNGGAVYFSSTGTVTNCNFVNNSASTHGGAVYFYEEGTVSNCNFINNTATGNGGAVRMTSGTVLNCTFAGNNATGDGGAVYFNGKGDVTNCSFVDNKATGDYSYGGAVYFSSTGTVTNCNFTNNSVSSRGGAVYFSNTGTVANCNFVNNSASTQGGAVYFYGEGNVTNCNFTGNNATTGSAISFYKRYSSDTLTVSNSTFLNNRANAEALDIVKNDNDIAITFTGQNNLLNAIYSPEEVTFTNVTYWGAKGITTISATMSGSNKAAGQNITVGVVVNNELVLSDVMVTKENGMIVLNISAGENYYISARHDTDSYYTEAETTISNNINVNVTSQTTTNKTVNITAKSNIYSEVMPGKLLFILPNGKNITANYAGNGTWWAVHTFEDYAIYQVNATYVGLDNVTINNATISISKTPTNITVENATVDLLVRNSVATGATLTPADAGNLTFTSSNSSVAKVEDGKIIAVGEGTAIITVSFAGSDDYAAAENKTITVNVIKYDSKVTISPIADVVYGNTVTIKYSVENKTNVTVTIDGIPKDKITITNDTITVIGLDAGKYTIAVINNESSLYHGSNAAQTFNVNKQTTSIAADAIATTYNINKDLVITLKDGKGKALSGVKVTVDLNGAKTYTTDKKGQVKVSTKGLAPKAYTAKLSFKGNTNYAKSTKDVKVKIKKATPKLTAKKKTFKTTIKTMKYTIVLKDNTGKAIKKAKVTLKVKGKTYKSTTNSKGKATFKISKLNKKGNFKAIVTYKGSKYYSKVTKKTTIKVRGKITAKLTVKSKTFKTNVKTKKYTVILKNNVGKAIKKAKLTLKVNGKTYKAITNTKGKATFKITKLTNKGKYKATITYKGNKNYKKLNKKSTIKVILAFKTVSKGSKDKETVKKIQIALKNNGYYLTYQGHYLMIDGKYQGCTVRSVNEFQHDKGLKTTGKVDEKTAKQLGII